MSKEIEVFEWIDKHIDWYCKKIEELKNRDKGIADIYDNENKMLISIKQDLVKAQEQEKENARYKKALKVIFEKSFDRSIKDYDDYNIWVEYKVEQFAKSIEKNPTILNWDMFDRFTYTQEEFDLLKEMSR